MTPAQKAALTLKRAKDKASRELQVGARGGKYYVAFNGKKVYLKPGEEKESGEAVAGDTKSLIWAAGEHTYAGEKLHGVPLKGAPAGEFWKEHAAHEHVEEPPTPALPKGFRQASGVVVAEPDGRVWILEPHGHFGGYEHTFPKGGHEPEEGLTLQQNAIKEAYEESGLAVRPTAYLGDFPGTTSTTRYYLAERIGGHPRAMGEETQRVKLVPHKEAMRLLNATRDKKVLAAVQAHLASAAGQKPSVIGPVTPPPTTPVNPMVKQLGGQKGSNVGGLYEGSDGVKRYVKEYKDPTQAHSEALTNRIYRDLGLGAPDSTTHDVGGKVVHAAKLVEGKQLSEQLNPQTAHEVLKGFGADVLTANWDAVGLAHDNVFVHPTGKVSRIDTGGSLLFRAQAGRKPTAALKGISEWNKLLDPSVNPAYSKLAKLAGVSKAEDIPSIKSQVQRIADLENQHGGWDAYVEKHAPKMAAADKHQVADMLTARTSLLKQKVGIN